MQHQLRPYKTNQNMFNGSLCVTILLLQNKVDSVIMNQNLSIKFIRKRSYVYPTYRNDLHFYGHAGDRLQQGQRTAKAE